MKVLLINPNRYQAPPVPPIGLEHVCALLEKGGHETALLDLCFSHSVMDDLDNAIRSFRPDVIGMTVRNIDTVLFHTNEFFLDDIRHLISHIKSQSGLKVILGGTGLSANPCGVLTYLGADYAVAGPVDETINRFLEEIMTSQCAGKIFSRDYRYEIVCPRTISRIDYGEYFRRGGIAGFETHRGCGSSCVYCLEANTPVSFKAISDVLAEIKDLHGAGFRKFHVCDSEFNEDTQYSIDFLEGLLGMRMDIELAVYMKPANYSRKMIRLMRDSGVTLITLTVDSWRKCQVYWDDIERIIFSAKSKGIRIVVDFLAGFPYESEDTLLQYLDMFRRIQPDRVGINTYIRLYDTLQITKIIMDDTSLRQNLIGYTNNASLLKPVFYNHLSDERLRELIAGDSLFRIEGPEKGVNYLR